MTSWGVIDHIMPEPPAELKLRNLFQLACDGDKKAPNLLVEQIGPLVLDYIRKLIRGSDAWDAQQVCWGSISKLYCRLAELTNDAVIVTWIRRIADRRCYDLQRAMRRQLKFSILEDPSMVAASVSHNPHREFVERLTQQLGSDERDVLRLRLEEWSFSEIASILGLSLTKVAELNRKILAFAREIGSVEDQS